VLAVLGAGCTTLGQGGTPSALMKASGTQATAGELRAATNSLAVRIPGLIEQSGNQMLAATLDPTLRKRALHWKIDGTSAFHLTLFRPDPLAGLLETWALAVQLDDWVETAEVRAGLGAVHSFAADAAHVIRADVEGAASRAARRSEGAAKMKELVEAWAHEHPIQGLFSTRPTAEQLVAKLASQQDVGLVEALGQATSTLDDLSVRVDLYAAQIPKTVTWEVELAALEGVTETDTGRLMLATLQSASGVIGRVDSLLGGTPAKELQRSLQGERVAVMGDLDRQRVDLLARLKGEREAVMQNIDGQRVATLTDLDRKLERSLQGADGLRQRAMADFEQMVTRMIARFAVMVGALLCLAAVLFWLLLRSKALARFQARRDGSA
jgi:hypothetical protein